MDGKVCKKCGGFKSLDDFHRMKSNKDGRRGACKACITEYQKRWYQANKERHLEQGRQWYQANKEHVREQSKQWREANKERARELTKQWREANKELCLERSKRWYEANKEHCIELNKQWYQANKEHVRERDKQWREANRERLNEQIKQWRKANKERDNELKRRWDRANREKRNHSNRIRRARKRDAIGSFTLSQWLTLCEEHDNVCLCCGEAKLLTIDHVIPLSKGGSNDISNIQPLCKSCNCSKGTSSADYRTTRYAVEQKGAAS